MVPDPEINKERNETFNHRALNKKGVGTNNI